jgi:SAM-dependent methyltransferase
MDPYRPLARVYDRWQSAYGSFSQALLPTIEEALGRQPVRSFLDFGCGTGELLLLLAARHPDWRLRGIDASEAMLACARSKPGAASVTWQEGRVGAPPPDPPYDAAGSFFNTLNHILDLDELTEAFRGVGRALAPGGLFLFDVNNPTGYQDWWQQRRRFAGPDWSLEIDARYDAGAGRARALVTVTDGSERSETVIEQRFHDQDELAAALGHAGFQVLSHRPWAPTPDDPPGATFWIASRR